MQDPISTSDTPKHRARRTYTKEFKAQLVAKCARGEKSIAQLSIEHQINANLIHKWTRQYGAASKQNMVPVSVKTAPVIAESSNRIEVSLGQSTVRFYGTVDSHSARLVLDLLR